MPNRMDEGRKVRIRMKKGLIQLVHTSFERICVERGGRKVGGERRRELGGREIGRKKSRVFESRFLAKYTRY